MCPYKVFHIDTCRCHVCYLTRNESTDCTKRAAAQEYGAILKSKISKWSLWYWKKWLQCPVAAAITAATTPTAAVAAAASAADPFSWRREKKGII
jgi:hypothetical protein